MSTNPDSDGRTYSFVLDTDVSLMPEMGGISIVGVLGAVLLLATAFVVGVFAGQLVAALAVGVMAVLCGAVVTLVTPSHCSRRQYLASKRRQRHDRRVRVHDGFETGGDD